MKPQQVGEKYILGAQKRRMDIALAIGSLPLSLPTGLISAATYGLVNRVQPIYYGDRIGKNGDPFTMFKFRSLRILDHGRRSQGYNDPRATTLGRAYRVVGLDELPQIANILMGDMSFIGPRPQVQSDLNNMSETLSPTEYEEWYRAYTLCRPGLISEFSVLTHRPDPLIPVTYYSRAEYDVKYANSASFSFDYDISSRATQLWPSLLKEAISGLISVKTN